MDKVKNCPISMLRCFRWHSKRLDVSYPSSDIDDLLLRLGGIIRPLILAPIDCCLEDMTRLTPRLIERLVENDRILCDKLACFCGGAVEGKTFGVRVSRFGVSRLGLLVVQR